MKRKRKRINLIISFFLITLFLLYACTTSKTDKEELSNEELEYAIKLMLSEVTNRAFTDFKIFISDYDFIPEELNTLNKEKDIIPGLSTILQSWTINIRNAFINKSKSLDNDIRKVIDNMIIPNPKSIISSGVRSASVLLSTTYYPEIQNCFINFIMNNITELRQAINQYNIYIDTTNRINPTNLDKINLSDYDISYSLSNPLCNYILNFFMANEDLYRTTPNSSNPQIIRQVFNI